MRASKFLLEETTIIMRNASSLQLKGVSTIGFPFDTGGYGGKVGFGKDVVVGEFVSICTVLISLIGSSRICFESSSAYFIAWFGAELGKSNVDSLDEQRKRVKIQPKMNDATPIRNCLPLRQRIMSGDVINASLVASSFLFCTCLYRFLWAFIRNEALAIDPSLAFEEYTYCVLAQRGLKRYRKESKPILIRIIKGTECCTKSIKFGCPGNLTLLDRNVVKAKRN